MHTAATEYIQSPIEKLALAVEKVHHYMRRGGHTLERSLKSLPDDARPAAIKAIDHARTSMHLRITLDGTAATEHMKLREFEATYCLRTCEAAVLHAERLCTREDAGPHRRRSERGVNPWQSSASPSPRSRPCARTRTPTGSRSPRSPATGYRCCVGKGSMRAGDTAVYVPDGALVPPAILARMGLTGKLAGPGHDRVKPIMLRGVLSEGLLVPLASAGLEPGTVAAGDDVTERLGIVKYEPPIPVHLSGQCVPAHDECLDFDVESAKSYPDAIAEGERVAVTEKIHGTFACLGYSPEDGPVVTSKGLGERGLKFDVDAEENAGNLYVKAWRRHREAILDPL